MQPSQSSIYLQIGDRVRFGNAIGTIVAFDLNDQKKFNGYQVEFDNGNIGYSLHPDSLQPLNEKRSLN
jgi:hypothetical protein